MPTRTTTAFAWCFASLFAATGCGPDPSGAAPVFPEEYATTYREVRDCRRSSDHDLSFVRVLASPDAFDAYQMRDRAFPVGSVVIKEEHADEGCGDLLGWTAMQKEEPGSAGDAGDWRWQRVEPDRTVSEDGAPVLCVSCHQGCGVPPDGYDWTCTVP